MNCPRCGAENPDSPDVHFCRSCGAQLTPPSPSDTDRLPVNPIAPAPAMSAVPPPSPSYYAVTAQPVVPVQAAVFPYGGFWIRLVAALIDGFVLVIVSLFVGAFLSVFSALGDIGSSVASNLASTLVSMGYEVLLTASAGGTLGKLVLGYHVVDQNGHHITYGRALGRWTGKIVSSLVFFLGFIWVGIDSYKQGWHDKIAGTYVVRKEFVKG